MTKFTLTSDVSVRTSSGEAAFYIPNSDVLLEADPQLAGRKVTLTEGTEITLCAKFEKTDTFMLAVTTPAHCDPETGDRIPSMLNGVVLRRASWEKVLKAK